MLAEDLLDHPEQIERLGPVWRRLYRPAQVLIRGIPRSLGQRPFGQFERRVVAGRLLVELAAGQDAADQFADAVGREGLLEEVDRAEFERLDRVVDRAVGGDDEIRGRGWPSIARRSTSRPSIPGSRRSSRTRSQAEPARCSSADSPVSAAPASSPIPVMVWVSVSRMLRSSSTIKTRCAMLWLRISPPVGRPPGV